MKCPRCKNTTFGKLTVLGLELHKCEQCRGVWLPPGDYEEVLELFHNDPEQGLAAASDALEMRAESYEPLRVACPACGDALLEEAPIHFDFTHHFLITDRCPHCGGVWLDAAELALLFKYMSKEDHAIAELAKKELSELARERQARELAEARQGKKPVTRRSFFALLFGAHPPSENR